MSTPTITTTETQARPVLPANSGGILSRFGRNLLSPGGWVYLLALAALVLLISNNPNFGDPSFLIRFLGRAAPIAIAAIGQYFVIVSGEFDLSMGAVIATQVVLAGQFIADDDSRIVPGLILMFVVGAAIGIVNGLATTLLQVPSFIVTLGMMLALTGFVGWRTGGSVGNSPSDNFRQFGRSGIENFPVTEIMPYAVIILIVLAVMAAWLMRRPFGRTLIAVGDNPAATTYSGSSVWLLKTKAFVLSSLAATVAGILLVGQAGVNPQIGKGYEFAAITAVVLGGVVLGGGRGWVLSAGMGAIALELLVTLLKSQSFLGLEDTWRPTVQGIIIVLFVALGGRAWGVRKPKRRSPATTTSDSPSSPTTQPTEGAKTGEN